MCECEFVDVSVCVFIDVSACVSVKKTIQKSVSTLMKTPSSLTKLKT